MPCVPSAPFDNSIFVMRSFFIIVTCNCGLCTLSLTFLSKTGSYVLELPIIQTLYTQWMAKSRAQMHTKSSGIDLCSMRYTLHILSVHCLCEWSCFILTAYSCLDNGFPVAYMTYMSHIYVVSALSVRCWQTQIINFKYFHKTQTHYDFGSRTPRRI